MMESIWVEVVLIVVAIIANGVFAGSELAIVSARQSRLAQLAQEGTRGAEAALVLKRDPEPFLATMQIAITLVGTLASAVGGAAAVEAVTPWLQGMPLPGASRWAGTVALGVVILAITYLSLVLGELAPKSLALRDPERAAALVAPAMRWLSRAVSGPARMLTWSARLVLALIGQRDSPPAPLVSEEEVKFLVREGVTQGVFERRESEIIQRALRFTDTPVRSVMVPRPNILGLDIATPPEEVLARAAAFGRTRLPVFRGAVDDTVGVVIIKDLLRCAAEGTPPVLAALLHAPLYVPETARVTDLLGSFQRHGLNLAMVVDEYGSVVGLVTMEDVLEEIVGEIREERERVGIESVRRLPDGAYVIEGTATVRDLRDRVGLPIEESPEYQTIAGYLLHQLQTIPTPGMSVAAGGFVYTVVDMDGPRIAKVKAQPREAAAAGAGEGPRAG
jgi:putative hemolysin